MAQGACALRSENLPALVGGPEADAVRGALERLLASADFDASPRSREFLRHVVEETVAGRAAQLSQVSIARRVFKRPDDFDPGLDPIVRIQAVRLRRSLERYYLLSGSSDPLRIELPRGGYVPAPRWATPAERAIRREAPVPGPAEDRDDWPTVVVQVFESPAKETAALLREQLATELGRYQDVRVVLGGRREDADRPAGGGARFTLGGAVREVDGRRRVSVRLVDLEAGRQIWADEYQEAPSGRVPDFDETVAQVIAARVASEQGIVARTLVAQYQRRPLDELGPYGALLRSYHLLLSRDAAEIAPAIEALRRTVSQDPAFGLGWTQLGRLYAINYAFEVAPIDTPIEEAVSLAMAGVRLEPTSLRSRAVLAAALLFAGDLEAAGVEAERALTLCPGSLVYLDALGWVLTLLGCWERGRELVDRAIGRNPHHHPFVFHARWVDHIRRGEWDEAYGAAVRYTDTAYFWRSLMLASTLGLLGRFAEAQKEVAELLRQKPAFPSRGRTLIGRLIKFPEVSGRILEGLEGAGLRLEEPLQARRRGTAGAMAAPKSRTRLET
jgi:adenylate cyclase